jgi:hypothetical protein
MRKRDRERWAKKVEALLKSLGAESTEHHYPWRLETPAGLLRLIIDPHTGRGVKGPGTVFARFDDPEQARRRVWCNPHSGKWNHHYFSGWDVEMSLTDLKCQLEKVMTFRIKVSKEGGVGISYYTVKADSEMDARVIAFCLDGGMAEGSHVLEQGHIELAKTYTEVA